MNDDSSEFSCDLHKSVMLPMCMPRLKGDDREEKQGSS
jgi:hypothetical protein